METLVVESEAFGGGAEIPRTYTCEGDDVPPPLAFHGVPEGTKSLSLIVDDPDAPRGTWVHWIVYDLPPETASLKPRERLPSGTQVGTNSWGRTDYGGPCPPGGRHRYVHTLYALDTKLGDLRAPTKAALESAMDGHILARAELIGTYQKQTH